MTHLEVSNDCAASQAGRPAQLGKGKMSASVIQGSRRGWGRRATPRAVALANGWMHCGEGLCGALARKERKRRIACGINVAAKPGAPTANSLETPQLFDQFSCQGTCGWDAAAERV